MRKKLTQDEFLSRSKEVFGDTYSYERVKYVKSHEKVVITCKIHGDFEQRPYSHLKGHGCNKCGDEGRDLKWTFEACKEEALKYSSLKDLRILSGSCYSAILRNKWKDLLCSHITCNSKPQGYWTYNRCKEEFDKYSNCTDLKDNNNSCKSIAVSKGWYKELSKHFVKRGHRYKRFLYACEFADNSVYVGLTYNTKKRFKDHLKEGSVHNHIVDCECLPVFKVLTEKPVNVDRAVELEEYYLLKYKDDGWVTLNRAKTGGVGGNNLLWTFEAVKKEALKYKSRSSFEKGCPGAYSASLKKKWTDVVCQHMTALKKPSGHWQIYKNCEDEALKYKSKTDFQDNSTGAYKAATKYGWLSSICSHMKNTKKPNGYYTIEVCKDLTKNCKTLKEYRDKHASAYSFLCKKGWQNIVFEGLRKLPSEG